jgi:hypothetical protein
LGEFYSDVIEAIDAVAENYQGVFGRFGEFTTPIAPSEEDIRQYLQDEMDWITTNSDELSGGDASIANLIQTLVSVYSKVVFLLGMK